MTQAGSKGELILYRTEDGQVTIQLRAVDGTVWLTQAEIADLFETSKQNVSLHLKNAFDGNELEALKKSLLHQAFSGQL